MPFDGFSINTAVTTDSAASLQQVTAQMEQTLNSLKQAVNAFLSTNAGQTIENYDEIQAKWNNGFATMEQACGLHGQHLQQSTSRYIDVDNLGARMLMR
jgi:uncharacterized protein YukE